MNPKRLRTLQSLISSAAVGAALLVVACTDEPSAPGSRVPTVLLGKAVSTTDMSVSSLSPDSATQDTTLDVVINGSGFVSGTVATWQLGGVADPAQVRTNSTRYVSQRQLVANITISAGATLGKWDVAVTASGKKGGIGTESFAIKARHTNTDTKPSVVWDDSVNVASPGSAAVMEPALITGDYRQADGSAVADKSSGEFRSNFCGVDGFMQSTQMSFPEAALNLDVDHGYDATTMAGACGGARYYQFFFSGRSSAPLRFGPQHYALRLGELAVGQTLLEEVHFGIQQTNCNALHFNNTYAGASNALVTRLPDSVVAGTVSRRWRVQSQGTHRAMCTTFTVKGPKPTGVTYYLPFAFTITELYQPFAQFP